MRGTAVLDYAARQPLKISAQARGLDVGAVMKATGRTQQGITGKLDADARATTALVPDPLAALKVTVDSYTLTAFEGVTRGSAAVNYGAPGQPLEIRAQARGVDVAAVMKAAGRTPQGRCCVFSSSIHDRRPVRPMHRTPEQAGNAKMRAHRRFRKRTPEFNCASRCGSGRQ